MSGRRLYRNKENALFLGVCAGLADFLDVRVWAVRLITIVVGLIFSFWPLALVYFTAAVLLRETPLMYRGQSREERRFWREGSREEGWR